MKISVVVCTKGRYKDLMECVSSITEQEFHDYEVIIVDGDGDQAVSTLARSMGFAYVDQKKSGAKMNTPAARNLGIKHSHGDIVAFIDDDAVPTRSWLSNIYRCYTEKKPAAVGGRVISETNSTRALPNKYKNQFIRAAFRLLLDEDTLEPGRVFSSGLVTESWDTIRGGTWQVENLMGTNMSFKRSWLRRVGLFDDFISTYGVRDETDLCVRIVKNGGQILYCSEAVVYHKLSPKGESTLRLYFSYFTDFYFLFKHRDAFSVSRFLVRETLLMGYLLLKSRPSFAKRNVWKYALKGRIDAYLFVLTLGLKTQKH